MDIDFTTKRAKTLSVLQNVLSSYSITNNATENGILEVIDEISHVAMYQYDLVQSKWYASKWFTFSFTVTVLFLL